MAALCNRANYYVFVLWFLLHSSPFFLLSSSPNLSGRRLDEWMSTILRHMMCLSASLKCMSENSEMSCMRLAEIQDAKIRPTQKVAILRTIAQLCRAISSQLRHVSTIGKKLLNSNISTRPRNMVNFDPLAAETDWRVWGTPANFKRFSV